MLSHATLLLLLPLLPTLVSAHGFVHRILVNDNQRTVVGPPPDFNDRNFAPSPIRQIRSPFPNLGADNEALNCGPSARPSSEILDLMPGDRLAFDWRGHDLSPWPHDTGPILTYLASCGDSPCTGSTLDAQFFKIHQEGKNPDGNGWAQNSLFRERQPARMRLPENLAPGHYLLRHEVIALHEGSRRRFAEYYPACVNIRVGGNGSGRPREEELVRFPGGYSDDHPGVFGNFYTEREYEFPGPRVAAFVTGGPSGNGSGNSTGTGTSTSTSTSTSTRNDAPKPTSSGDAPKPTSSTSTASNKKCRLKKNQTRALADETAVTYYPRHVSRVMRRMVSGIRL